VAGSDLDKRKGKPRIQRRLSARFGTEAKMCGGTVLDISEGGMRIESPESFPVNSVITVFVQFPRHSVRLRARIIWGGGASGGGSPAMGLALTQPEPTLKRAYAEWVAEVKLAAAEAGQDEAQVPPAPPVAAAAPPQPAAPPAPEPKGPITRRLESRQGQSYQALLERKSQGWSLTIIQLPRQLGVDAPDFVSQFPDYASAEKALRDFVRAH
jgi:PilZ domain-containing protein